MKPSGLPLAHDECTVTQPDFGHFCQLHQKETSLVDAAIQYLQVALASGENVIIITRPARQKRILDWLDAKGSGVSGKSRRIFIYSGSDLLDNVMKGGMPDWERFYSGASTMLEEATWSRTKTARLYGDAVSDLWQAGNHAGAVELEACWNRFRRQEDYRFSLFCGYLIQALNPKAYSEHLMQLCTEHNFVIAAPEELELRCALDEASREVLGSPLSALKFPPAKEWQARLPDLFRLGLGLKEYYSAVSDRLLQRASDIYHEGVKPDPWKTR